MCIATWQPLLANDWLTIPAAALRRFGSLPDAVGGPGMFAQSDPEVITSTLAGAGFDEIEVAPLTVTLTLGADPAAADYLADSGPGRAVLETVPTGDQPAALGTVRAVLADHVTPAGVQLDGGIWITTARRPG